MQNHVGGAKIALEKARVSIDEVHVMESMRKEVLEDGRAAATGTTSI